MSIDGDNDGGEGDNDGDDDGWVAKLGQGWIKETGKMLNDVSYIYEIRREFWSNKNTKEKLGNQKIETLLKNLKINVLNVY